MIKGVIGKVKEGARAFADAVEALEGGPVATIPDWDGGGPPEEDFADFSAPATAHTAHAVQGDLEAAGSQSPYQYAETPLERESRRAREYFEIIVRIEKERDGWVAMYRTQVSEHLTAQGMLERQLIATRKVAARAVKMLNAMRSEKDMSPVECEDALEAYEGEPVGIAERYATRMKALHDAMPAAVDGAAERDAVQ
ncbi:MAG: hypothetical protein GY772_06740 [bacterium]|nr:hypothetical protein [bacterium]